LPSRDGGAGPKGGGGLQATFAFRLAPPRRGGKDGETGSNLGAVNSPGGKKCPEHLKKKKEEETHLIYLLPLSLIFFLDRGGNLKGKREGRRSPVASISISLSFPPAG